MADLSFYLTKRDYLYDPKATPAKLAQAGRTLLEREAFSDALDFFERARDAAGLQAIKTISLERGDSFLLARLERFDRKLVSEQDWQAVAVTAERNGMPSMAKFARKRLAPPEAAVKPGVQPLEEAPATEKK